MKLHFDVENRKELAKAVSEINGAPLVYEGAPSMNYRVDYFYITKDGSLEFNDRVDGEKVEALLEGLAQRGFAARDEKVLQPSKETQVVDFSIAIPLEHVSCGNLTKILEVKGDLIKKAFGLTELPIVIDEEKISFPWFKVEPEYEICQAASEFIVALCKMSKEQKRITAQRKEVDNDKYAFRCFLLRLGFIGKEYKEIRKTLLKNLSGNSAFKGGAK